MTSDAIICHKLRLKRSQKLEDEGETSTSRLKLFQPAQMSFKVVRCVAAKSTQVGVLNGKFRLAAMMRSMIEVSESRRVVLNDKLARPR
jgi:hypothetical protein